MDRTEKDVPNNFSVVVREFVAREALVRPLLSDDNLQGTYLAAVFRLSGIMSHICLYGIVTVISCGSTNPAFSS
jgi:hypothetical protein